MLSWREIPYFRVAFVLIAGIVCGHYWSVYPARLIIALSILVSVYGILSFYCTAYRSLLSVILLIIVFLVGALRLSINNPVLNPAHFSHSADGPVFLVGVIQDLPRQRKRIRHTLEVEKTGKDPQSLIDVEGKILVYFTDDDGFTSYHPGDRIVVYGRVRYIEPPSNPESFDYRSFMFFKKVHHQLFVATGKHRLLQEKALIFYKQWAADWRSGALAILHKYLKDPDHLAIASAMILGYKNEISTDLYEAYSDSGAIHVLAVSGLHVGIVAGLIFFLFRLLPFSNPFAKFGKVLLGLSLIWFYVLLTGGAPAVQRAGLMFTIWYIGKNYFENAEVVNVLSFAAVVLLLSDPYLLFQLSFQFSFLALGSIIFFFPILSKIWVPRNKWVEKIWHLAVLSVAAQILVAPLTLYYFHKFPVYFILSGIVAIPLAGMVLTLGLGVLILEVCIPVANEALTILLQFCLDFFITSVECIQALPMSTWRDVWVEEAMLIPIYSFVALMMGIIIYRSKRLVFFLPLLMVMGIYLFLKSANDRPTAAFYLYDTYGYTCLDIMLEDKCYNFISDVHKTGNAAFVCQNIRLKHGIRDVIHFVPDTQLTTRHLMYHSGLFQLSDTLIFLADRSTEHLLDKCGSIDVLVILEECHMDLDLILQKIKPRMIVISNALPFSLQRQYQNIGESRNVPCHVISQKGAYQLLIKS